MHNIMSVLLLHMMARFSINGPWHAGDDIALDELIVTLGQTSLHREACSTRGGSAAVNVSTSIAI